MNNEEKKIIGYDPQTGQPIYGGENPQPVSTETKKKSNVGLIIGIIVGVIVFLGIVVFAVLALFGGALVGKKATDPTIVTQEKTFYGESFEINYKSPWSEKEGMLSSGKEQKYLSYNNNEIVLYALGSSDLSKTATQDFSTSTGKFKLYNDFREYWGKTDNISNGTGTFFTLTDGVYYASMDYTRNKTTGKLYIIASEGNNILLTFSTYVNIDKNKADKEVLELFKNMTLNTIYDDELAGYLDTMSNWNTYKSVRSGSLGTKKTIEGGWRTLASTEEYWTFNNGEFYFYKSVNNLNDNYYQGTYKVYTGKTGAAKVGIEASKIDAIVSRNKGIKETDIYTLILTPKKLISGGEDKSTSLGSDDWQIVWILVDHGKEGFEGQLQNVKSGETSYYVKIKD